MDKSKASQLAVMMTDKLPAEIMPAVIAELEKIPDDQISVVQMAVSQMKNPSTALILSFFLSGGRAYIGEAWKTVFIWILWLFSSLIIPFIIALIWWIIDLISISKDTKKKNWNVLRQSLSWGK